MILKKKNVILNYNTVKAIEILKKIMTIVLKKKKKIGKCIKSDRNMAKTG